jgi:hypothetical protein
VSPPVWLIVTPSADRAICRCILASPQSRLFGFPRLVDENVLRLDIAVNDTFLVGSIQAIGDFNPDLQPLLDLEMAP